MNRLRVAASGLLTTVQDLGRPGYAHLGVSPSGAADPLSFRIANRLVGNPENTPALEMTLLGGTFVFDQPVVVALAGSWCEANIPVGEAVEAAEVRCGPLRGGARCYLAVAGGLEVPRVLGSASAHLTTGLGGGALRRLDELPVGVPLAAPLSARVPAYTPRDTIRATETPWRCDAFWGSVYQVSEDSNRMGLRLRGPAIPAPPGRMLTEGVPLGAVQVPPDGQPIILWVEHQTTGGYPRIANVISADFQAAGQLRPRDRVCLEPVSLERALELLRRQEAWLHGLA